MQPRPCLPSIPAGSAHAEHGSDYIEGIERLQSRKHRPECLAVRAQPFGWNVQAQEVACRLGFEVAPVLVIADGRPRSPGIRRLEYSDLAYRRIIVLAGRVVTGGEQI